MHLLLNIDIKEDRISQYIFVFGFVLQFDDFKNFVYLHEIKFQLLSLLKHKEYIN